MEPAYHRVPEDVQANLEFRKELAEACAVGRGRLRAVCETCKADMVDRLRHTAQWTIAESAADNCGERRRPIAQ